MHSLVVALATARCSAMATTPPPPLSPPPFPLSTPPLFPLAFPPPAWFLSIAQAAAPPSPTALFLSTPTARCLPLTRATTSCPIVACRVARCSVLLRQSTRVLLMHWAALAWMLSTALCSAAVHMRMRCLPMARETVHRAERQAHRSRNTSNLHRCTTYSRTRATICRSSAHVARVLRSASAAESRAICAIRLGCDARACACSAFRLTVCRVLCILLWRLGCELAHALAPLMSKENDGLALPQSKSCDLRKHFCIFLRTCPAVIPSADSGQRS